MHRAFLISLIVIFLSPRLFANQRYFGDPPEPKPKTTAPSSPTSPGSPGSSTASASSNDLISAPEAKKEKPEKKNFRFFKEFSIDLGVGLPQLASVNVQARLRDFVQIGVGYGLVDSRWLGINSFKLPEQDLEFASVGSFKLQAQSSFSLMSLTPFVRVYPFPLRDFYIQFSYTLLRLSSEAEGDLVQDQRRLPGALKVSASITQAFPTLAMGHLFSIGGNYINFSMGVSYLGATSVDANVTPNLPEELGTAEANAETLEKAKADLKNNAQTMGDDYKKLAPFFPSFQLAIGFTL